MANEQNLRPPFTPNEAREFGSRGGKKSAQVRNEKKTFAAMTKKILNTKVTDPKQLGIIQKSGMPVPKNPTYKDFLIASTIMKAIRKGSPDDIMKFMNIIGENLPGEMKIELTAINPEVRDEIETLINEDGNDDNEKTSG